MRRGKRRDARRGRPLVSAGLGTTLFTLSGGTFANGAQQKAAAGSLPARITVEDDYLIDAAALVQSIMFGSGDTSIVLTTGNTTKKYAFGGTQTWSASTTAAFGLWRAGADLILVSRSGTTTLYEITESTQVVNTRTLPAAARHVITVPGGTADRYWTHNGTTTLTEVVASTLATTGRTITTGSNANAFHGSNGDGTPGIYVTLGTTVVKYKESDLSLEKTWTANAVIPAPGCSVGTEICVDSTGRPVLRTQNHLAIDRFTVAAGNQAGVADRLIWGGPENFGVGGVPSGGGAQSQPAVALSSDGRYIAFTENQSDQLALSRQVRVRNILTQTAKFTTTPSGNGTLKRVVAAGNMGNSFGPYSGWRSGDADYRRTRVYYKRVGTDGSPVEVTPNAELTVALTGGQDLEVTVEFRYGLGMPGAALPYVQELGVQIS